MEPTAMQPAGASEPDAMNQMARRTAMQRMWMSLLGAAPNAVPKSQWHTLSVRTRDEHQVHHVRIQSEEDDWIAAYVLVPQHPRAVPCPVVICLHPTIAQAKEETAGFGGRRDFAYGLDVVQRGFVAVVPDHLAAGERLAPGQEAYDTSKFYQRHPTWSAVGKAIWDVQRIVDGLQRWPFVDAQRIGVLGHSLGGHSALFAWACDDRIRVAVSNCGVTFFNTRLRWNWCRSEGYGYLPRLRVFFDQNEPPPVEMDDVAVLGAPRPLLNISGLEDATYADNLSLLDWTRAVERSYRLLGHSDAFATYFHGGGHSFPPDARQLAYAWLERWLDDGRPPAGEGG